jgi:hypothetical protein
MGRKVLRGHWWVMFGVAINAVELLEHRGAAWSPRDIPNAQIVFRKVHFRCKLNDWCHDVNG